MTSDPTMHQPSPFDLGSPGLFDWSFSKPGESSSSPSWDPIIPSASSQTSQPPAASTGTSNASAYLAYSLYGSGQQDPDLAEYLADPPAPVRDAQGPGGAQRRSNSVGGLPHSRPFPGLQSPTLHSGYGSDSDLPNFGTAWETQLPSSSTSEGSFALPRREPPSSRGSPHLQHLDFSGNGHSGRLRTSSEASLTSGFGYRSRSDSESSSAGGPNLMSLNTPITPEGQFAPYPLSALHSFPSNHATDFLHFDHTSATQSPSFAVQSHQGNHAGFSEGALGGGVPVAASSAYSVPFPNVRHPGMARRGSESSVLGSDREASPAGSISSVHSGVMGLGLGLPSSLPGGPLSASPSRRMSMDSLNLIHMRAASVAPTILEQEFAYGQSRGSDSGWTDQDFAKLHLGSPLRLVRPTAQPQSTASVLGQAERHALLAPYIRQYLTAPNRLLLGERTVLVLSGKVAQKSYGVEKRFLCPPPSALLLGCSWWSAAEPDPRRPFLTPSHVVLHPPTTSISMSGERTVPTEAYSEWMTMSGRVAGEQASMDDSVIAGRCVGKQLHISEVDERTKKVQALVHVAAPGFAGLESRQIGAFPSKPIKVISKPSKKRQNVKNVDLCIHHGTTIALFNRLRSQTVSTKYLCVSGPSASFPAGDWKSMTGLDDKSFAPDDDATCFVARTSAWDPFIIYLVDPSKPSSIPSPNPPLPGYPRPPSNALPLVPNGCPVPIYYNQPVVFQCLSTAVVSPVMILRRVDKASTAVGGASLEGFTPNGALAMPVAPGETLGEPVSQLHKVALEVVSDPQGAYAAPPSSPLEGFPGSGSFLACLGENVGVHKAPKRQLATQPLTPPPSATSANQAFAPSGADAGAAERGAGEGEASNDGGKVKVRGKRAASASRLIRGRKRTGSMSSVDDLGGLDLPEPPSPAAAKAWTIECGEPAVWTIVGCDVERHTFWIPPVLMGGAPSSPLAPGTVGNVFTTPVPGSPLGANTHTPIPSLQKYIIDREAKGPPTITLYGTNLRPHLWVWFDDAPSPHIEVKCPEAMSVQVPPGELGRPRRLVLVRDDGVVFPSQLYYRDF